MSKEYVYRCDYCLKLLSLPSDPKRGSEEHIHIKGGSGVQVAFAYYSRKEKAWKQSPLSIKCEEYQFCNGRCLGNFIDKKVGEVTKQLRREE